MKITYKIHIVKLGLSSVFTKDFKDGLVGFAKYRNVMEQNNMYKVTILNIEKEVE